MQRIVTLTERKLLEMARRQRAVAELLPELAAYACRHGGRFLLYGSAVRGQMKYDSDVDLLVDFPDNSLGEAWNFAETVCWDRGLEPDLMPYSWCKPGFLEHVARDLRVVAQEVHQ
jgi:predicted nucleotidyltransferase